VDRLLRHRIQELRTFENKVFRPTLYIACTWNDCFMCNVYRCGRYIGWNNTESNPGNGRWW